MSARTVKHVRDTIARDLTLYHERKGWDWSPEEILTKGLEKAERMAAEHAESGDRYGYVPVYTAVADELRQSLDRMRARRAGAVVDDRAKLAAELELLSGEHRALLGPVDRTGATDKAELDRFMARSKNLDTRVEQLRTAHFPEAATLGWQAGTWFTCGQHGENHRTVWTEQDGLVDDVDEFLQAVVDGVDQVERERWIVDSFAPPADAEPALGGQIPDVGPVGLDCPGRDGFAHDWDEYDLYCRACDATPPRQRAPFSQAGLMSLVGAR